jgi:hypothetical protein
VEEAECPFVCYPLYKDEVRYRGVTLHCSGGKSSGDVVLFTLLKSMIVLSVHCALESLYFYAKR